jgi:O-antigen/teichoic acid export membrane protein
VNHEPTDEAPRGIWEPVARWCRAHPVRAGAVAGWYQQTSAIVSSLVVLPIIIRILGPHEAGQWFALQSLVTLIGLADFGFSMVISRQVSYSLQRAHTQKAIAPDLIETAPGWNGVRQIYAASRRIFFWVGAAAIVGSITIYQCVLPHTNLALHGSIHSAFVWYTMTLGLVVAFQARLSQSILDGFGRMEVGRFFLGTHQLLVNLASAAVLSIRPSLLSMSFVVLASSILLLVFMKAALRRVSAGRLSSPASPCPELDKRLWRVALPFGFVNSGAYLGGAAQIPLLGSLLGPAEVTPYYVALRVSQGLYAAVAQLTTPQLPFFTGEYASGKLQTAMKRMARTITWGTSLHICAAAFLYFGSPPVVDLQARPSPFSA